MPAPLLPSQQVFLIRHGETEWSLSGRHTGRTDIALLPRGERQAGSLAAPLRAIRFASILSSPRQRARHTAELAGLGATLQIEPDLAEWDYGDYEGLTSAEIERQRAHWNIFRDGCPGGETPAQVSARADRLIARLRTGEGKIALFTHGHFGRVLAMRWIGLELTAGQHFELSPASLSVFGYAAHHPEIATIQRWNDTAHLAQVEDANSMPHRENEDGGQLPA